MPKINRSIPIANRNAGLYPFDQRAMEPDFDGFRFKLLVTNSDANGNLITPEAPFQGFQFPFNDPTMLIYLKFEYSWDGGVTWPGAVERGPIKGEPTGRWGAILPFYQGISVPFFEVTPALDFIRNPIDGRPTHYRGHMQISKRITAGIDLIEL